MKYMSYLVAAYSIIWAVIFVYTLILGGRQKKLAEELSLLKKSLGK